MFWHIFFFLGTPALAMYLEQRNAAAEKVATLRSQLLAGDEELKFMRKIEAPQADVDQLLRVIDKYRGRLIKAEAEALQVEHSSPCAICQDESQMKDVTLTCGHSFHRGCIDEWFIRSKQCPECRQTVPNTRLNDIVPPSLISDDKYRNNSPLPPIPVVYNGKNFWVHWREENGRYHIRSCGAVRDADSWDRATHLLVDPGLLYLTDEEARRFASLVADCLQQRGH